MYESPTHNANDRVWDDGAYIQYMFVKRAERRRRKKNETNCCLDKLNCKIVWCAALFRSHTENPFSLAERRKMMVVNRKFTVYHLFNDFENWPDEKSGPNPSQTKWWKIFNKIIYIMADGHPKKNKNKIKQICTTWTQKRERERDAANSIRLKLILNSAFLIEADCSEKLKPTKVSFFIGMNGRKVSVVSHAFEMSLLGMVSEAANTFQAFPHIWRARRAKRTHKFSCKLINVIHSM